MTDFNSLLQASALGDIAKQRELTHVGTKRVHLPVGVQGRCLPKACQWWKHPFPSIIHSDHEEPGIVCQLGRI